MRKKSNTLLKEELLIKFLVYVYFQIKTYQLKIKINFVHVSDFPVDYLHRNTYYVTITIISDADKTN